MGQGCMKDTEVNGTVKKSLKCNKCNCPLMESSIHQCMILTKLQANSPTLRPSQSNLSLNVPSLMQFYGAGLFQAQNQSFNLKVFENPQRTQTLWIKEPTWFFPINMSDMYPDVIRKRSFQQKLYWFRLNVERLRISWQNGAQKIKVDRSNILMSSKQQLQKVNLRKQIKIAFTDQTVDDAGGLLRQFMHLALKQIFSPQSGIFQKAPGKQLSYRFRWDQNLVEQYVTEYMKILGYIIGKALFERVSINCYLDRTILRQITGQAVHFQDFFSYDADQYKSLKSMLSQTGASQVGLNFCIYHRLPGTQALIPVELVPGGQEKVVKDHNKQEYAKLLIHHYCTLSCGKYLQILRQHIYKVVPHSLLSVFEPIQLQMILYGPSVIDINDWKMYTEYKGYKPSDKQIIWFWEYMQKQTQQKLRHFIHYVTGTSRVPILGFKYLESNRNQLVRFTIQRSEYQLANPYPKSYTCFNRIHLPVYPKKQELFDRFDHITKQELTHFGLD